MRLGLSDFVPLSVASLGFSLSGLGQISLSKQSASVDRLPSASIGPFTGSRYPLVIERVGPSGVMRRPASQRALPDRAARQRQAQARVGAPDVTSSIPVGSA